MFHAYGYEKGSKLTRIDTWTRIEARRLSQGKSRIDWLHECPPLPSEIAYLWNKYAEIRQGAEKIGFMELDAYCRIMGEAFEPWEISLILELETCRMTSQNLD